MPENYRMTEEERKREYERRGKKLIQWIVVLYSVLLIFISLSVSVSVNIGAFPINLGMVLFTATVLYTLLGFRTVSSNKIGVVRLFGEAVKEVGSGLTFVLPLLCELQPYEKKTQVLEIGSAIEDDKGDPIIVPPKEGVVIDEVPFRISLQGDPKSEDVLERPLTIDPRMQIQWAIRSTITFDEQKRNIPLANNELVEVAKSSLQKILGSKTPKKALADIDAINKEVQKQLEWLVGEPGVPLPKGVNEKERPPWWGIDILSVGITTIGLPRRVNQGFADARQRETLAEATRTEKVKAGQGDAAARELFLEAEATGRRSLAKVAKTPEGMRVLELETARTALQGVEKVIITPAQDLLSAVAGVVETAKQLRGSSASTPRKGVKGQKGGEEK